MLIARINPDAKPELDYPDEIPSIDYFYRDRDIPIVGKLYDRGILNEKGLYSSTYPIHLPDLYLARKQKEPGRSVDSSWASIKHVAKELNNPSKKAKYASYDGYSILVHAEDEKNYMWLQESEIIIVKNQAALAKHTLERWSEE
jgi:hypothetical protein